MSWSCGLCTLTWIVTVINLPRLTLRRNLHEQSPQHFRKSVISDKNLWDVGVFESPPLIPTAHVMSSQMWCQNSKRLTRSRVTIISQPRFKHSWIFNCPDADSYSWLIFRFAKTQRALYFHFQIYKGYAYLNQRSVVVHKHIFKSVLFFCVCVCWNLWLTNIDMF